MARPTNYVNNLQRQVNKVKNYQNWMTTTAWGPQGSVTKNTPVMRALLQAGEVLQRSAMLSAPPITQAKWWEPPFPKFWKFIYTSSKNEFNVMSRGKILPVIPVTMRRTKKGKGKVILRRARVVRRSGRYSWSKMRRPRGRLKKNILVKPATGNKVDGNVRAVFVYARFSRARSTWDKANVHYARFLEDGTRDGLTKVSKRPHKGVKSTKGWWSRGIQAGEEHAKQLAGNQIRAFFYI